jgi:ParB-like chromosome segregation protein Spo0J
MPGDPPLKPLHPDESLSPAKLAKYDRLTTEELIGSLRPGQSESLRVRPDGTIIDGHHRVRLLNGRGVDVDHLPREVVPHDDNDVLGP